MKNDNSFFNCAKELQENARKYINLSTNFMAYQQNIHIILSEYGYTQEEFDKEVEKRTSK